MIPAQAANFGEGAQKCGGEDAAGAETGAFRGGSEEGDFKAAAELAEEVIERPRTGVGGEAGMEASERESGLREGKLGSDMREVFQFLKGADARFGSEVDGADHDFAMQRHASENLHGRLAIEIERNIHHRAAAFQAIRRRVGPATGEVDADRAASPDDLVIHCSPHGCAFFGSDAIDHQIAQKREGTLFIETRDGFIAACVGHLRAEHGLGEKIHRRAAWLRQRRRGGVCFRKKSGRAVEVEAVKGIVAALGKEARRDRGNLETSLGEEARGIEALGDFLRGEALAVFPERQKLGILCGLRRGHPGNHAGGEIRRLQDRK